MQMLDSLTYRIWFNVRRKLPWIKTTIPEPVIWKPPKSLPSPKFVDDLDEEEKSNFLKIHAELELISRLHNQFPSHIKDFQWKELLALPTRRERINYLKFIKKNEVNRAKFEVKKQEKASLPKAVKTVLTDQNYIFFPPELKAKREQILQSSRFYRSLALNETPKIAVDCRFIPHLTKRAQSLTSLQLAYMMAENQKRAVNPWPLYFVNFDQQHPVMRSCVRKHLTSTQNPKNLCGIVSDLNYTDFFDRKDIIYLSPDAEEVLETVEDDKTYVIGAIVDRVPEKLIPKHASLEMSQVDRVQARRLPLDEFVEWKSGTQFLTLVTVMKILQMSFENGCDWQQTFEELIPVRYTQGPEEKNTVTREYHSNFRKYDSEVMRILEEKLGRERR